MGIFGETPQRRAEIEAYWANVRAKIPPFRIEQTPELMRAQAVALRAQAREKIKDAERLELLADQMSRKEVL